MARSGSVAELLDMAIEIERSAAFFYDNLSRLFSHEQKASDFWKGMKADEIAHVRELESVKKGLSYEQLNSFADDEIVSKARVLYDSTKAEKPTEVHDLDEAYELAYKLEESEVNRIMLFLVSKFVTSEKRVKFVLEMINEHTSKLADFPRLFGDDEMMKTVKARRQIK